MTFASVTGGPQLSVEINIPANLLNHKDFEAELESTIFDIALEARSFWETEAGQRLTTSRERYIAAIGMEQAGGNEVSLTLKDSFAQSVEKGTPRFDMKPGFLKSPKIKDGPVKLPRAVAASLQKTGRPAATKWMIIPLNLHRQVPMGYPAAFRTFTDKQPNMWIHKGFKGVHIADDVVDALNDEIIPKHIDKLIDRLYGGS